MKPAVAWAYAATLLATAGAWLAPDFTTGLVGDLGLAALQWLGVFGWGMGLFAAVILALQWFSTPKAIRRDLWRNRQF